MSDKHKIILPKK